MLRPYLNAFGSIDEKRERFKQTDPDSVWLVGHPDYPPSHGPSLTFTDSLTLNVGNHTFNIIHMPGHTAPQTSVHVPEEGVVFTGDNVFHKCRTWHAGMRPLGMARRADQIEALDVEMIVPGPRRALRQGYLRSRRRSSRTGSGLSRPMSIAASSPDEILKEPMPVTSRTRTRSGSACSCTTSG